MREVITKDVAPETQEIALFRGIEDQHDDETITSVGRTVSSAARVNEQIERLLKQAQAAAGQVNDSTSLVGQMSTQSTVFSIGDHVVVIRGDLKRMDGTVVGIEKSTLGEGDTKISVRPSLSNFDTVVCLPYRPCKSHLFISVITCHFLNLFFFES